MQKQIEERGTHARRLWHTCECMHSRRRVRDGDGAGTVPTRWGVGVSTDAATGGVPEKTGDAAVDGDDACIGVRRRGRADLIGSESDDL
jgi:hypothetical protein